MSGDQDNEVDVTQKRINGGYKLSGLVILVGALLIVVFCSVRLAGYLEYKDFKEGICVARNGYQLFDSPKRERCKIWCSCNDREKNEKPSPCSDSTGPFEIPCMRLNLTVVSTGHHTWMRNTYHLKGHQCTNSCKYRTIQERYTFGREYRCWYDPTDHSKPVVAYKYFSQTKVIHSLIWPGAVFVAGFIGLIITFVCQKKHKNHGSMSY